MEDIDKDWDDTTVKQEIMDMPEDLSAKYKSVSVQTEKWGKYIFEDLFDGFSQKQMKTFINILDKFVAKKDNEHIADREQLAPEYCKIPNPCINPTGWTPLEPVSPPALFTPHISAFQSYSQLPPLQRMKTTQATLPAEQTVTGGEYRDRRGEDRKKKKSESETQSLTSNKQLHYLGIGGQSVFQTRRESEEEESKSSSSYQGRLSRDERLVMDMRIPLTVREIIEKPMEDFNDLLTRKDITEEQINTCRDIRRRGKNKIAAQNCRKRKIEQISCLETDLRVARYRKENILSERVELLRRRQELVNRLGRLEKKILSKMGKEDSVITVDQNMLVQLVKKNT